MSTEKYDYGPLRTYEIIWNSGHTETLQGHQLLFESWGLGARGLLFPGAPALQRPRMMIHGEFGGHWRLVLAVPEDDILSVRDVTDREEILDEQR